MKSYSRHALAVLLIIILLAQSLFILATDTLSKGDKGEGVKSLQTMLNAVNSAGLNVDGSFGALTETALKNYQKHKGIAADGIYGPATKAALEADYEKVKCDYIWPLKGTNTYITSYYGGRVHPITGKAQNHSGIDIRAPKGTPIYAAESGTLKIGCNTCTHNYGKDAEQLKKCGCGNNYGNYAYINHPDGMVTLYAHLSSIDVADGTKVEKGQQIATVGSTGRSTGFHLHFEMRVGEKRTDPLYYVEVPPFITIGEGSYSPKMITSGSGYYLSGKISSIYTIVSVTLGIYYPDGKATEQVKTFAPQSTKYDIANLDSYIRFGKLKAGNYVLKVQAADGSGASKVLVSEPFAVTSKIKNGLIEAFTKEKTYIEGIFTDINKADWFRDNVALVYETGLMQGVANNLFNTEGNVTVAEAITVASRIYSYYYGKEINTANASIWYKPYVEYAATNGIYTASDADLNKPATREQLALMLARAVSSADLQQKNDLADNVIPDVKMTDTAADEIYLLYRAGVLTGSDSKGSFLPQTFVARSEMAAMITRIISPDLRMEVKIK